ncbi:MAG TPA: SRPBCC family protein, partial [Acidimicrobiales bacterium]|nr:SRPBCC family protein [Acidimicrobiales bacterium]
SRTTISLSHPQDVVFATLTTPETYPCWLVGAREIRAVDEGWPAPGTRFHHRVGLIGPLTVSDSTKLLEADAPERLVLEVRARPLGRGRVTFTLAPGPAGGTQLTLDEVPIGYLAPLQPVIDPVTTRRNEQSLDNLRGLLDAGRALDERLRRLRSADAGG